MKKIKVQLVKYDLTKTKNRKRKDMLVEFRSEIAVIAQLERIHKGEEVVKIHEILWDEESLDMEEDDLFLGTVKFFDPKKGFGFIVPDGGGTDVFVHISAVEKSGMKGLNEGQKVTYELAPDRQGRMTAAELKAA